MRLRWIRLLPLLFAALWLPLQAVAASAMPFCRHGEAHRTTQAVDESMEHCPMHDHQAPADHGLNCDDCGFCHLASAGFMPAGERVTTMIPAGQDFQSWVQPAPASNIPEPPQHPPRRTT